MAELGGGSPSEDGCWLGTEPGGKYAPSSNSEAICECDLLTWKKAIYLAECINSKRPNDSLVPRPSPACSASSSARGEPGIEASLMMLSLPFLSASLLLWQAVFFQT